MEKSTSTPTQHPPPPTSSLPTAADQPAMVASELPSLATDLNTSPAFTPVQPQGQTLPTPGPAAQVPTPPSIANTDPLPRGRKRALEKNLQIENSNYYKMRLLLKDLRPHVLEILRAPDFRNCKGAIEIQEKMKLMHQLYQEMIGETTRSEKAAKTDSFSNGKTTPQSTATTAGLRSSEASNLQTEKHSSGGDFNKVGHSMIGGSAFGWNFVTYGGTEAVYCGISKEEYRSSHPVTQAEPEVVLHKTL